MREDHCPDANVQSPARILFVTKSLDVGGTERHLERVLPGLAKRGIGVSLFSIQGGGRLEPELRAAGIAVVSPQSRWPGRLQLLPAFWELLRLARKTKPKVIHAFLPEPYFLAAAVAPLAGIPALVMSRRSLSVYQDRHPLLGRIERRLHRHCMALVANSSEVARELKAEGASADRVHIIHNGIELPPDRDEADKRALRAEHDIPAHALVMVILANLIPYKGHADLFEALGLIRQHLPDAWRLLVVGRDTGLKPSLLEQARQLSIDDNVIWIGEAQDPSDYLGMSDVGILASHEEGFSNALLEMMAEGLPVVATRVGGNPDAIDDGVEGLLAEPRAPQALAAALLRLASDQVLRLRLGRAGKQRVANEFSLGSCIEEYEKFYRQIHELLRRDVAPHRL